MRTFCKKVWRIWWFNHCLEDNMRECIQLIFAMVFCKHKILWHHHQHMHATYKTQYMQSYYIHRGLCLLMEQEVRSKYGNKYKLKRSVEQPNSCLWTALPFLCLTHSCTSLRLPLLHFTYWYPVNMWPPIAKWWRATALSSLCLLYEKKDIKKNKSHASVFTNLSTLKRSEAESH